MSNYFLEQLNKDLAMWRAKRTEALEAHGLKKSDIQRGNYDILEMPPKVAYELILPITSVETLMRVKHLYLTMRTRIEAQMQDDRDVWKTLFSYIDAFINYYEMNQEENSDYEMFVVKLRQIKDFISMVVETKIAQFMAEKTLDELEREVKGDDESVDSTNDVIVNEDEDVLDLKYRDESGVGRCCGGVPLVNGRCTICGDKYD